MRRWVEMRWHKAGPDTTRYEDRPDQNNPDGTSWVLSPLALSLSLSLFISLCPPPLMSFSYRPRSERAHGDKLNKKTKLKKHLWHTNTTHYTFRFPVFCVGVCVCVWLWKKNNCARHSLYKHLTYVHITMHMSIDQEFYRIFLPPYNPWLIPPSLSICARGLELLPVLCGHAAR